MGFHQPVRRDPSHWNTECGTGLSQSLPACISPILLLPSTPSAAAGGGKRELTSLQPVDVLGVEAQEQPLVVQQAEEIVGGVGAVVAGIELLGQGEEGLGVDKEIPQLKDSLGVGDVVLLQVAIQATPRGPVGTGGS